MSDSDGDSVEGDAAADGEPTDGEFSDDMDKSDSSDGSAIVTMNKTGRRNLGSRKGRRGSSRPTSKQNGPLTFGYTGRYGGTRPVSQQFTNPDPSVPVGS